MYYNPSSLSRTVNSLFHHLGTSCANTICQQLVNGLDKTCAFLLVGNAPSKRMSSTRLCRTCETFCQKKLIDEHSRLPRAQHCFPRDLTLKINKQTFANYCINLKVLNALNDVQKNTRKNLCFCDIQLKAFRVVQLVEYSFQLISIQKVYFLGRHPAQLSCNLLM